MVKLGQRWKDQSGFIHQITSSPEIYTCKWINTQFYQASTNQQNYFVRGLFPIKNIANDY